MRKQLIGIGVVAFSSLVLVACGQKSVQSGNHTIYDTEITSTKAISGGDWLVSGTTNAPDGTKIMATTTEKSTKYNQSSTSNIDAWPKAKNGKFKIHVSAIGTIKGSTYKAGQKAKIAIMGITKYNKSNDDEVSSKIVSDFKKDFDVTTLTVSAKQARYINNLGDDGYEAGESESSSDSDSSTSYDNATAFESSLNQSIQGSKETISDIQYNVNTDGNVDRVTMIVAESIQYASNANKQEVADAAFKAVTALSDNMGMNTPSVTIQTSSGNMIAQSNADNSSIEIK